MPKRVDTVLISAQHREEVDVETLLAPDVEAEVIDPVLREFSDLDREGVRILVNPTGRFEIGGPKADTGLTGRKIIVDSYGGMAPHGGGCFSGKDPTKVDRSAAYMARYVAKNLVAAGAAERLQLQVAYAIGTAHPVSLAIDTFGTEHVDPDRIVSTVWDAFDFRPAAIIRDLNLRRPIFADTAAYGHFGRKEFPWEATDRADELRSAFE
jgi:S-adenosylmethionine synthetase